MNEFASGVTDDTEFSTVCGSPGEVANDAFLGHQLSITHGGEYDWHFDMDYLSRWGTDQLARSAVWTMQALYANDQLRQRMAWALSQILVLAVVGGNFGGANRDVAQLLRHICEECFWQLQRCATGSYLQSHHGQLFDFQEKPCF